MQRSLLLAALGAALLTASGATAAGVDPTGGGHGRPLPHPPICPHIYRPVCGVDHHTYANACEARVHHVAIAHPGVCHRIILPPHNLPTAGRHP